MTTKPILSTSNSEREKSREFEDPISVLRQRKTELLGTTSISTAPSVTDFDSIISKEQQSQENITSNLLMLTRTLKEQAVCTNTIVKQDLYTIEKSNRLAEENQNTLETQTLILKERSGFCTRCWVWLILILVVCCFIGKDIGSCMIEPSRLSSCFYIVTAMVIFMRLFRKQTRA